jgi:hypothetical protein
MQHDKITDGKHTYILSGEPIVNGDMVYNIFAKTIDRCLLVDDGMMSVEYPSGGKGVFSTKNYKKAIKQ